MASVLDEICAARRATVAARKAALPLEDLRRRLSDAPPRGFARALRATLARGELALIAEIKKASPSKGLIRPDFDPPSLARAYDEGGATCLSVLTEERWFQGADRYLEEMLQFRGGLLSMLTLVRGMFPTFAEASFADRAREVAERPGTDPTVRGQLLLGADTLDRMLKARG